jgi:hypothetical protein
MGYLFFFEPARIYLDGNKQGALAFFGKTVGVFAGCVVIFIILMFVASASSERKDPEDGGEVFCTMDAKICPDGSSVGRVGPDCEFAPCPTPEFY